MLFMGKSVKEQNHVAFNFQFATILLKKKYQQKPCWLIKEKHSIWEAKTISRNAILTNFSRCSGLDNIHGQFLFLNCFPTPSKGRLRTRLRGSEQCQSQGVSSIRGWVQGMRL